MIYEFICKKHGEFEIESPISVGPKTDKCPICEEKGSRVYSTTQPIYYTDGFHKTDYGKYGHKRDLLMKKYETITGEKAPPPATDIETQGSREHMHEPKKGRGLN